jgi:heparin binding hemagglutinin HbhA
MKVVTDIRKSSPVMAVVGVTDLAVGALRTAQADLAARASKVQGKAVAGAEVLRVELAPAKLQADAQNLPNLAINKTLEAAGKAEETYGELAARGKSLVRTVRRRPATKDLFAQGRSTLTLGKAAVTTVRKASDETITAAKATITSGRREAAGLVSSVVKEAETEVKAVRPAARTATSSTRSAGKRTVTTARTRAAGAKKATKAVRTSATRSAAKTVTATKSAAATTGTPRKTATSKSTTSKTAARKTTARKTTAGSTTARKTTARKTAPRKAAARKTAAR